MIRSMASKVLWVGRATVFLVGLAVVLALTVRVISKAAAHTGVDTKLFHLGHSNTSAAISKLVGSVAGPMLRLDNNSTGTGATALDLQVEAGKAPLTVNSSTKVNNLNADRIDGMDPGQLPGSIASTQTLSGYPGQSFSLNETNFSFVGPTVTATTTSSQRLVGAVQVPLAKSSGGALLTYDLCYQPSGGGTISNFSGPDTSSGDLTTVSVPWVATASVVPGAGTWRVGFCAMVGNSAQGTIDRNGYVNGWVQAVNQ